MTHPRQPAVVDVPAQGDEPPPLFSRCLDQWEESVAGLLPHLGRVRAGGLGALNICPERVSRQRTEPINAQPADAAGDVGTDAQMHGESSSRWCGARDGEASHGNGCGGAEVNSLGATWAGNGSVASVSRGRLWTRPNS